MKRFLAAQFAPVLRAWRNGYEAEVRRAAIAFFLLVFLAFGVCLAVPELRLGFSAYLQHLFQGMDLTDGAGNLSPLLLLANNLRACAVTMLYGLIPFVRLPALALGVNAVLLGGLAACYAATDTTAKTLNDALFSAIDKHAKFLEGKTTPLTISATRGGEAITPGEAVFTSEFGTVVTVKNTNTVALIPATYTFDLSDGEFRHVRGTLEVKEGTTLTAQLPAGQWIKSVGIGIDNYWKTYGEMPKQDVTASEGTYLIPDHAYNSLYPYFEPGDGVDTTNIRVYKAGDPNAAGRARQMP